jgi:hypothetical protein
MAIKIQHFDNVIGYAHDPVTGERGFVMKCVNRTGGNSVKGTVLSECPSENNGLCAQYNEFDALAVCAESGIVNGAEMWVWKGESFCQVLWKDGETATRASVAICADTDGRALNVAVPSANPVVAEHFKEIGHVAESKTAGTDVLVLCHLHFN